MSAVTAELTCTGTGLRLVAAGGETASRVAKDRHGALFVPPNFRVGPLPIGMDQSVGDRQGRFDTIGSTVYLADSRRCACAEVLVGFGKGARGDRLQANQIWRPRPPRRLER